MARETVVETTARLHFGFTNLSLKRNRLFGSLGLAIDKPHTTIRAEPAEEVVTNDDNETLLKYARRATELLEVDGAKVSIEEEIPRHVGLGSGTQLALGVLTAIAETHGVDVNRRRRAPALGRGKRSGVGITAFEDGGFVYDGGRPVSTFRKVSKTNSWDVAPVVIRKDVPKSWRFVVVIPEANKGKHGEDEETSLETVIEHAESDVSDKISARIVDEVLPGIVAKEINEFGRGVEQVGRLNGRWYSDFQDGVYRESSASIIRTLANHPSVKGAGQSSWGPASFAITPREAAADVVNSVDRDDTTTFVARPDNTGYSVTR